MDAQSLHNNNTPSSVKQRIHAKSTSEPEKSNTFFKNEEVIKYLLDNTNASIIPINKEKDFNESISGVEGAIRLYPFNFEGEGHFICLIKCNDERGEKQ